jgi:hypothetical protein
LIEHNLVSYEIESGMADAETCHHLARSPK